MSVQVIENSNGKYVDRKTVGSSKDAFQVEQLISRAEQWILDQTRQGALDFTNHEELTRTVFDRICCFTTSGCATSWC